MSPSRTRRERDKAARRQSILDAARQVFLSDDLEDATIDDVASVARISKGTIYLYFQGKEALLAHLLKEGLGLLHAQLAAAYAADELLAADVRVARLAGAYLEFARGRPGYFRLVIAFDAALYQANVPPDLYHEIQRLMLRPIDFLADAIQQGIEQRHFRRVDPWRAAVVLWANLNGLLLLVNHPTRSEAVGVPVEALLHDTLQAHLRALKR
jgi:AcrR family transcriptional regulator